jgi:hypothetical protein
MAFVASRPVPWRRIIVPFLVYAVIANVGFAVFMGDNYDAGVLLGTVIGGIAYLAISVTLVKFGWNPPRWGQRGAKAPPAPSGTPAPSAPAPRPAPTKRTNATNPRARTRR